MKIEAYLQLKYQVRVPTVMTQAEADAFGVPYPLQNGWLEEHGQREMNLRRLRALKRRMARRLERQTTHRREFTEQGIAILESLINQSTT